MGDPKSPKQPAWKRASGAREQEKQPGNKGWQPPAPGGPKTPVTGWGMPKWAQVALAATALLGVAGVALYLVIMPKPDNKPHFILLRAGYETNLAVPHNAAGVKGSRELEALIKEDDATDGGNRVKAFDLKSDGQDLTKLFKRDLFSGDKTPRDVIVYVSAHGIGGADGNTPMAFLLANDFEPGTEKGRIPLDKLLEGLKHSSISDANKLLVLDIAGIRGDATLGQFHSGFLQVVESPEFQNKIKDVPKLAVLVSADKDEFSWVAPEWGTTTFAHYFLQGLKNEAKTSDVTVESLLGPLKKNVAEWARNNRFRPQNPKLFDPSSRASQTTLAIPKKPYEAPEFPENTVVGVSESREMWEECLKLEKERSPWLTSPLRWRSYQDCLIRAEELYRAGDKDNALAVRKEATALKASIELETLPPAQSFALTSTMPDVLSAQLKKPAADWLRAFDGTLKAGEFEKCLAQLVDLPKSAPEMRDQQLLRSRASRAFLLWAVGDPKKLWDDPKAQKVLEELKDPLAPRSAEAHFLVMLRPDGKGTLPLKPLLTKGDAKAWDLVKLALSVRLLAEESAAGLSPGKGASDPALSAELLAWTRKAIEEADAKRRLGHDLLFTSNEKSEWATAETHLLAAKTGYEKAQAESAKVRRAILTRDLALAQLPYYTRWLAHWEINEADEERLVKTPWQKLRELNECLEAGPAGPKVKELPGLTEEVNKALIVVREKYREEDKFHQAAPTQQDKWHEIDALLRVPVMDRDVVAAVDQRAQLLTRIHQISYELHKSGKEAQGNLGGPEKSSVSSRRQARLALHPLRDREGVPSDWEEKAEAGLRRVGEWVTNQITKLPADAREKLKKADEPKDLPTVIQSLAESAALARRLEGWAFDTRPGTEPSDAKASPRRLTTEPAEHLRKHQLHAFLAWQASRAYLDFWAAADGDANPYYRVAGLAFLRHADTLLEPRRDTKEVADARYAESKRLDGKLKQEQRFFVETSSEGEEKGYATKPSQELTRISDEDSLARWHRLRGPSGKEIPGQPVAWVEDAGGVEAQSERPRIGRGIDEVIRGKLLPVGDLGKRKTQSGKYTVKGYFRGHETAVETPVMVYGEPDLVVVRPEVPGQAMLSLQAPRDVAAVVEKAALAIVLDCSGSMYRDRLLGTDIRRWDAARDALRKVLRDLPRGIQVSLRGFSAKNMKSVTTDITQKNMEKGYARIERVWEPHSWNPDPKRFEARMKQVDELVPDGATPLLRAMWMARDDFKDFQGRRIMVVVTDGGDSNFYDKDKKFEVDLPLKKKTNSFTINDFLQAAFKTDKRFNKVELHVIGFDIRRHEDDTEDMVKSAEELPVALKNLGSRGVYHDVKNSDALAQRLRETLLKSTFIVDADFSRPGHDRPHEAGTITPLDEGAGGLSWLRIPARDTDRYTVRMPADRRVESQVRIERGERMALQLVPDKKIPKLQRLIYAQSEALKLHNHEQYCKPQKRKFGDETWHVAALQNELARSGDDRLKLLLTLEQDQGPGQPGRMIQAVRPQWTWFEVHTGGKESPQLRVFPVQDYPAPAWGMAIPDWPGHDHPVKLKAWWRGQSLAQLGRPFDDLGPGENLLSANLKDRPWNRSGGDGVILESVTLEKALLNLPEGGQEGRSPKQVEDCLVVRLRYPETAGPYFVTLQEFGDWQGGQAHRWFRAAGKYTGIFWPVNADNAANFKKLFLFSVPELKHPSKSASIELDLGNPKDTYKRPTPP